MKAAGRETARARGSHGSARSENVQVPVDTDPFFFFIFTAILWECESKHFIPFSCAQVFISSERLFCSAHCWGIIGTQKHSSCRHRE